jgi:Glycosyltransferase family 87
VNAALKAAHSPAGGARRRLAWVAAGVLAAAVSSWAMYQEVAAYHHPTVILAGQDFWNNTWLALRELMSGANIYAPVHAVVPGIEPAWPASPHVPASLLWQAPFAAMPIPIALFAFTLASILAIWAGIFVLARPAAPWAVIGTAACGAFAIGIGGGPETLLLGQPTGFMLLGLAILVRTRRPWLAGLGLMLAATTLQTGLPLALALLVLNGWPVLWRGMTLILGCSALPVGLEVANSGLSRLVTSFTASAAVHLGRQSNRIDLGALLRALGISTVLQVAAGIALLGGCLAYIATLPHEARRIDSPPVLSLVVSVTLLCTYHQYYDMLLVGAGLAPLILIVDRSWRMLPCLGLAVIGATLAAYQFRDITTPLCLVGVALASALATWMDTHRDTAAEAPALIVAGQPTSWQVS